MCTCVLSPPIMLDRFTVPITLACFLSLCFASRNPQRWPGILHLPDVSLVRSVTQPCPTRCDPKDL